MLCVECHYAECRYAGCRYAEGRGTVCSAFSQQLLKHKLIFFSSSTSNVIKTTVNHFVKIDRFKTTIKNVIIFETA
jgi:hypothetical protein